MATFRTPGLPEKPQPPQRVRVIRVLEYDYPDQATAEADMQNWGVPPNGTRHGWGGHRSRRPAGVVIRSATTFPQTMPHQDPESDDRVPAELTYEQQVEADLEFPEDAETLGIQPIQDLLSMVEVGVSTSTIKGWTLAERKLAVDWAAAVHLSASDNDVEIPPRPKHLPVSIGSGQELVLEVDNARANPFD